MSDVWTPLLWRPRGPLMPFIIKTVDGRFMWKPTNKTSSLKRRLVTDIAKARVWNRRGDASSALTHALRDRHEKLSIKEALLSATVIEVRLVVET